MTTAGRLESVLPAGAVFAADLDQQVARHLAAEAIYAQAGLAHQDP